MLFSESRYPLFRIMRLRPRRVVEHVFAEVALPLVDARVGIGALDLLVDEWADGDEAGIGALMANPEMLGSQPIYDVMMTDRNARWVPQITAMLEEPGTVLIAVGAGHLAGEDSVVEMLRDAGYTVEGP